jgi:hypothetical protein
MRITPKVATWLLTHFGSGPNNDVVLGDLTERYQEGLPRMWYWKQCLKAILSGLFGEYRAHKLLTVRALILGWTVIFLYFPANDIVLDFVEGLRIWSRWWRHDWLPYFVFSFNYIFACVASGWAIARLSRAHRVPMVLIFMTSLCGVAWTRMIISFTHHPPRHFLLFLTINILIPIGVLFGGGILRKPAIQ